MRKFAMLTLLLSVSLLFSGCFSLSSIQESKDEAVLAAKSWLKLVDSGKYEESWDKSAPEFQKFVPRKDWPKMLVKVRKPRGTVVSRKLISARYTTELPGAPQGEYVVIEFRTKYSNSKTEVIERVTPMMTKKGWAVSGFYITPLSASPGQD